VKQRLIRKRKIYTNELINSKKTLTEQDLMTDVKICGIRDTQTLTVAQNAGANFVGFVFAPGSPRLITPDDAAPLARQTSVITVGLFVDPQDDDLNRVLRTVPLKMIQLHGNESPTRVSAIRAAFGLPVMKAIRLADKNDLNCLSDYEQVADWLLFDTKTDGAQGGSGRTFDWNILKNIKPAKPWMLAGGLNDGNVADALSVLSPDAIDVSSGVESAPGIKDAGKITAFIDKVRHA